MATTAKPGITLVVNGKDVPLKLDTLSLADGAEFELVRPVRLGTPGDLAGFVGKTFGVTTSVEETIRSLPDPLDDMADRLLNLEVTVEEFRVKVPPKSSTRQTSFAVGLSGTWPFDPARPDNSGPIELIAGSGPPPEGQAKPDPVLGVKGLYLLVERDDGTPATPAPPVIPPSNET